MTVTDIVERVVLPNEGGYVNNPNDAGGETNFGITAAVARQQGYTGAMKAMPRSFAVEVYKRQYADAPGFTAVSAVSMAVAAELIDTGVNMGPQVAGRFLQRTLNVLGEYGLLVDGNVGAKTVDALRSFLAKRGAEGERRLLLLLNALQGTRYIELVEARRQNAAFMYGWAGRIAT